MMICINVMKKNSIPTISNLVSKVGYSRRSDKNITSYKLIKSNEEPLDDIDSTMFGTNSNWELLTPVGFRFYLPGSVGPGWLNLSTTAQVTTQFLDINDKTKVHLPLNNVKHDKKQRNCNAEQGILHCVAQECPMLLRKGIEELFPGCLDVSAPQLTIVTISQKANLKTMRWNKEGETEKLTKYFVLAASEICTKLKMVGYWADFINPFSGQPYLSQQKNNLLYETDERFRCLGFTIEEKNNCKIISCDTSVKNFIGSLYTTAPASTEFLKEIISNVNKDE